MEGIFFYQHGDRILNLTKLRAYTMTINNPDVRHELNIRIAALESVLTFLNECPKDAA
jgi:hypothetical protein